jgi:uncharacterized protein
MIRLLDETDRAAAIQLLADAPQFNLYLLGNLETLGFGRDFCEFWGDFGADENGELYLRAVLNRYMAGWAIYGTPAADWAGLGGIVDTHPTGATRLQDNPGGAASFLPYLHHYHAVQVKTETLMNLRMEDFRPSVAPVGVTVRRGVLDDVAALAELYADAGDMARTRATILRPLQDTRLWLIEEGRQILAAALTNAETAQMAMIGGVFTLPSARGRGLSQAVCSALCTDLFAAGKQPVLYWINPAAGAVYHKLGFRPIGQWRAAWLEVI